MNTLEHYRICLKPLDRSEHHGGQLGRAVRCHSVCLLIVIRDRGGYGMRLWIVTPLQLYGAHVIFISLAPLDQYSVQGRLS